MPSLMRELADKDAEIERLRVQVERANEAWVLLSRWENVARNGGQAWLREHPLTTETTELLNSEALNQQERK